jgi:hypothetical protein
MAMPVETLTLDRSEAHKMWLKYQTHKHYQSPFDAEVERIYKAIANGKVVVNALASIVKAGLGEDRLPKLAIARADERICWLAPRSNGSASFSGVRWPNGRTSRDRYFDFPADSFPGISTRHDASAAMPHIPPDIRPKRGIQNYHVLWEAIWRPEPPRDPLLLRRVGKTGDFWLVVGAWELTDVERAVMAGHMLARRN